MSKGLTISNLPGAAIFLLIGKEDSSDDQDVPTFGPDLLAESAGFDICRIGPRRWLCARPRPNMSQVELEAVSEARVVNLTNGYEAFEIEGSAATRHLSGFAEFDLGQLVATADRLSRIRLADVPVILQAVGRDRWVLYNPRSYAAWIRNLIADERLVGTK